MDFKTSLILAVCFAGNAVAMADDFVPLFKTQSVDSLELVQVAPQDLSFKDGELRMSGASNGYFATKESYKNFTLKFDFLYERPEGLTDDEKFTGNSGLLVYIETPHAVWPKSIEFQLMNREVGQIYRIKDAKLEGKWDKDAYKKAIKPVGQWNTMEVTSKGGTMTCSLNGIEVARGTTPVPNHGPFGWQSEGAPLRFRNMLIKKFD